MAATTRKNGMTPEAVQKQWEELEREREVLERHYRRLADLRANIAACEEKYGITSDQIHDAIENRELQETLEVCRWIMDYERLKRITS